MSSTDGSDELQEFVRDNIDLLSRILAYGDAEACGYALAVLANGGTINDIEEIQRKLNDLKQEVSAE